MGGHDAVSLFGRLWLLLRYLFASPMTWWRRYNFAPDPLPGPKIHAPMAARGGPSVARSLLAAAALECAPSLRACEPEGKTPPPVVSGKVPVCFEDWCGS